MLKLSQEKLEGTLFQGNSKRNKYYLGLRDPSALTGAATLLLRTDFAELRAQPLARAGGQAVPLSSAAQHS
jgi:hypothetical protein